MLYRPPYWLTVCLVGLLFIATACTADVEMKLNSRPPVTKQGARELVTKAIDHTLTRDFASLCGLANSRSMCESDLKSGALERVSKQAPRVVCSYEIPDVVSASGRSLGGRVLVVDGIDGTDRRFVTEVLVFHDGQGLVATNVVWWSNRGIASTTQPGQVSTAAVPATPEGRLQKCEGSMSHSTVRMPS